MLPYAESYEELRRPFRWHVPSHFNIGQDVCDRWARREPDRVAIINVDEAGRQTPITFGALRLMTDRLANVLALRGLQPGDRVGIFLPQVPEVAVSHLAVYKLGGIAVPLFFLFGPEALQYRLGNSGARALVTNRQGIEKLREIRSELSDLAVILSVDGPLDDALDYHAEIGAAPDSFTCRNTRADDAALIIYTSGTTGMPKGALHAHRVLLGHLPGVEMSHNFFPRPGDRMWTPADWAWIGGLLDVLLPALHHGVTVIAHRFPKFTGEAAFKLINAMGIRNAFLPPTALKLMRAATLQDPSLKATMRSVASGGESLASELIAWGRQHLGTTINEFYGQTECNMIVSSCAAIMEPRPGVMGRPVPGHHVEVIHPSGTRCDDDVPGAIAVKRDGNPVMFLEYWNNPVATAEKFAGDWLVTGDIGARDPHGWIKFIGRDDDTITSAGYRIGPNEVEDCLLRHPAVLMVGVVGKPDPDRTEIVKAYIVLTRDAAPSEDLARSLQGFVKERLSAHEYPREIEFIDELPLTATGKIIRRELRNRAAAERAGAAKS